MSKKRTRKPVPMADRLLVERDTVAEKTTAGGLIILEKQQEIPCTGKITATGPSVTTYKVGDTILFGKFAGNPFTLDDKPYLLLKESEILVKVV